MSSKDVKLFKQCPLRTTGQLGIDGIAQAGRRFPGSLLLQREHRGLEPSWALGVGPWAGLATQSNKPTMTGDGLFHPLWWFWGWFMMVHYISLWGLPQYRTRFPDKQPTNLEVSMGFDCFYGLKHHTKGKAWDADRIFWWVKHDGCFTLWWTSSHWHSKNIKYMGPTMGYIPSGKLRVCELEDHHHFESVNQGFLWAMACFSM